MGAVLMRKVVEVAEMDVLAYLLARTKEDCTYVEDIAEVEGVVDDKKVVIKYICHVGMTILCSCSKYSLADVSGCWSLFLG
ncbi:hypothetical protein ZWY2020_014787 [Hordeum vulgare]|nr:hypothetical protein ZWY2020_014787 [Hordeum vulgare]